MHGGSRHAVVLRDAVAPVGVHLLRGPLSHGRVWLKVVLCACVCLCECREGRGWVGAAFETGDVKHVPAEPEQLSRAAN
jgi:hypothetical protein